MSLELLDLGLEDSDGVSTETIHLPQYRRIRDC